MVKLVETHMDSYIQSCDQGSTSFHLLALHFSTFPLVSTLPDVVEMMITSSH